MALVDRAAGWLARACEPYAALEPRFWTVPPAYHVQELCFCLLVAVAAAALSRRGSRSKCSGLFDRKGKFQIYDLEIWLKSVSCYFSCLYRSYS